METLKEKIARVLREDIAVVPYNPRWPRLFTEETQRLRALFPRALVLRIEHFGSTAVPGLAAKPIVDMLVEVRSLVETQRRIAPVLESQGYDYFWRPSWGDDVPPFYAWFIKRNAEGERTHHIHMVEANFEHWERLLFRDYLIEFPRTARAYGTLKQHLSTAYARDRVAYTAAKTKFIVRITKNARERYGRGVQRHARRARAAVIGQ